MVDRSITEESAESSVRRLGRIPVRNIWLLMLYASDLYRTQDAFSSVGVVTRMVAPVSTAPISRAP